MCSIRELSPADARALTPLYGEYDWWADRTVDDVRSGLAETDLALGIETDGDLVASARVVTDYTYYATVYDVIVARDRRREGVGTQLLSALVDHPDLQSLPRLSLLCREGLVAYYETIGFERFDREIDVPEGESEELVRMHYHLE